MKDFEVKNGPAGVGYRQHEGYVVLVQPAYRDAEGNLTSKRSQDVKLAYPAFFELPDKVAVAEGIKPEAKK